MIIQHNNPEAFKKMNNGKYKIVLMNLKKYIYDEILL